METRNVATRARHSLEKKAFLENGFQTCCISCTIILTCHFHASHTPTSLVWKSYLNGRLTILLQQELHIILKKALPNKLWISLCSRYFLRLFTHLTRHHFDLFFSYTVLLSELSFRCEQQNGDSQCHKSHISWEKILFLRAIVSILCSRVIETPGNLL